MRSLSLIALLSLPIAAVPSVQAAAKTLFDFRLPTAANPEGGLIADRAGNLYGTTVVSRGLTHGAVFKLVPPASGQKTWTEIVLAELHGSNGDSPTGNLIFDNAGNLYGTALMGGRGLGTVYEVSPPAVGQTAWTLTKLYTFLGQNGELPNGGLLLDAAGNLYGTTRSNVFELSPPSAGQTAWTEKVIFAFNAPVGVNASGPLLADKAGNFYGMASAGGPNNLGTVFELSPPTSGQKNWTPTLLFAFNGTDGQYPEGGLFADKAGNLYGTTLEGGADGFGTVFELTPPPAGQTAWTETVLFSFNGTNGGDPTQSLIGDESGNLYGTTSGKNTSGYGNVFKLAPPAAGQTAWTETNLLSFDRKNGADPECTLLEDKDGRGLYGTTFLGGLGIKFSNGRGTVFEVKP